MTEQIKKASPIERLVHCANKWRQKDKESIADKGDDEKRRAEYFERKNLRKAIDEAGGHS